LEPEKESASQNRSSLWLLVPLGILVWFCSLFGPSNTIEPYKEKRGRAIRENDSAGDNHSDATVRPHVSYVPPTTSQYHGPDRRKDNTPKWKKKAEIIALVTAILLLLVNGFIGGANWRSANAAKNAVEQNINAFRIDERAWVTIEPIRPVQLTPEDAKFPAAFTCDIYPKNVGKTVATDLVVKAESSSSGEELGRNAEWMSNMQEKYLLGQFKQAGTNKPVIVASNPVPKFWLLVASPLRHFDSRAKLRNSIRMEPKF